MSAHDVNDDNDSGSTILTVALIGGGAALLWLLLRGRGKGWGLGWGGTGSDGGQTRSGSPPRPPPITIMLRDRDRIEVNKVPTDFATMLARARAASQVHLRSDGMTRERFFSKVLYALLDEDINVQDELELRQSTPRIDAEGRTINDPAWTRFEANHALARCLRMGTCLVDQQPAHGIDASRTPPGDPQAAPSRKP